jgi:hypothetical protein
MFLQRRKKTKTDLLREQMNELTGKAVVTAGRAATTLAPKVDLARGAALVAYENASSKVRDEYAPLVLDVYVPRAAAAAAPHVTRARAAAAPTVATALAKMALFMPTPEPPKKKSSGTLKKLLVVSGVGGVSFAVAKKVQSSVTPAQSSAPPRPTPVPNPAPNPTVTPTPVPPIDVDKPAEAQTTKPLVDTGDANPAGNEDGHSTGR